jgi:hypothetical protein
MFLSALLFALPVAYAAQVFVYNSQSIMSLNLSRLHHLRPQPKVRLSRPRIM